MKHYSIFALAAAGMLLSACSSDNNMENTTVENLNPTTKVNGYFKASINLPQNVVPASTRAWEESKVLDDGLAAEYKVNSTLLLIFSGKDEASAKLIQVTPINSPTNNVDDDPKQITVNSNQVVELTGDKTAATDSLFALAVCNGQGVIEKGADSKTVVIGGTTSVTGATLADLQAAMTAQEGEMPFINGQGFFMTNAILSTVKGGAADPTAAPTLQILAPISSSLIYDTEAEAEAADAATDIYVERGVAKATISSTNLTVKSNIKAQADTTKAVEAKFAGWCLDNTNLKSYIVRKVDNTLFSTWNLKTNSESVTTDAYRFVGGNAVDNYYSKQTLYRTYWATDPNYNTGYAAADFYEPMEKVYATTEGEDNPLYCFENTFDVANQTYQNTTRAIVKLTLNDGKTFYTIANDKKTLWAEDSIKALIASSFLSNSTVKKWFKNHGAENVTITATDLTFTFGDDKAGYDTIFSVKIAGAKLADGADLEVYSSQEDTLGLALKAANNTVSPIRRYVGGETYYSIRIKHFGDDLTPWNADEYKEGYKPAESTIATIYPGETPEIINNNYLGRYGMVRNNWYDIALGTVMKIGSALPPYIDTEKNPDPEDPDPEDPEHPDDEVEQYLKVQINVLSWAKRTQTWDLK